MTSFNRLPSLPLIILAFGIGSASAERKPVALGMVGGITSTSYYGDDVRNFDFDIWPTVGFTLAFHLPAFLGLETDLIYVGKSGSIRRDVYDPNLGHDRTLVSNFKLHALEIPFMLKVTAPTGTEVQPMFFGGPSLAWFFSRKSSSDYIDVQGGGIIVPEEEQPIVPQKNLAPYEWSLCVGAGVEWGLGSFQMRVNFGQKSLDKTNTVDVRTANLAVMAGFIF
jgi:hypothetical protein